MAFIVGRPGTSKTRNAVKTLERLTIPHVFKNATMPTQGLWDRFKDRREDVTALDDIHVVVA